MDRTTSGASRSGTRAWGATNERSRDIPITLGRRGCSARLALRLQHCAPLTAGRQNVHKTVHHLAHDHRPFASARLAGRNERYHQLPFLVGHIARIAQLAAVIARANSCSSTSVPPQNQATTLKITTDSLDSRTLRTDT